MPPKKKKQPLRVCLGCRESKDKRKLVRVVRTPEGEVEIDFTGKRSGRGAYICPAVDCLKQAVKNKGLEKSLRRSIPLDVVNKLQERIEGEPGD